MNPIRRRVAFAGTVAGFLLAAGALGACQVHTGNEGQQPSPSSPELKLKIYDVPAGYAEQLRSVLSGVFSQGDKTPPVAKASVSPDGRLIVMGTEGVQEGVAAILADMGSKPPPSVPTIEMKYWIVLGKPGGTGALAPELQEIAPALEAVSKAQGGLSFEPYEKLVLRSIANESGEAAGHRVKVWQSASVRDGMVDARLNINQFGPARLETRVALTPDQTLVLGETGTDLRQGEVPGLKLSDKIESRKLFFVVRPTIIEAKKTP